MNKKKIKKITREKYGNIAKAGLANSAAGCGCGCCGGGSASPQSYSAKNVSKSIGYSDAEINAAPESANLGLGCGNPLALASIKRGEVILDLGSGGGFDCFLAAKRTGKTGKVIGIDMTPAMVKLAKKNAKKGKYANVEFRLGEIEALPVANNSVDIIISNCVINLVPDKKKAFKEALRVLKPGGRLMVSDIVLTKELPPAVRRSVSAYVGCLAGASKKQDYIDTIAGAGFEKIKVLEQNRYPVESVVGEREAQSIIENLDLTPSMIKKAAQSVLSVKVYAMKPKKASKE